MVTKKHLLCGSCLWIASAGTAIAQSAPAAFMSAVRYDAAGKVVGTISADPDSIGSDNPFLAVRTTYDSAGRPELVESGRLLVWKSETIAPKDWGVDFVLKRAIRTTYDVMGRKLTERVSGGSASTMVQFSYDAMGRLECTAIRMNPDIFDDLPDDACTLGTEASQGPDRITKNVYNAAGHVQQVIKALGTGVQQNYVTYTYTPDGQQESITDANGNKATMEYDGYGRRLRWRFPSKTTAGQVSADDYEQYGYDTNGNITSLRKRDTKQLTFTYDALNRVMTKLIPGGCVSTPIGTCASATADLTVYYGYDLRGLQTDARFGSMTGNGIVNVFDGFGQITSSTNSSGGVSRTLSFEYDAVGNRIKITHPDGTSFSYDYDNLDRLTNIKNGLGNSITNLAYYATGERSWIGHSANGTGHRYDGIGRLDAKGLQRFVNGSVGIDLTELEFNPASQIVRQIRSSDAYAWTGAANIDRGYTVNGLNQYTAAGPATYSYDANGNLTVSAAPEGLQQQLVTRTYEYDAENRLYSATGGVKLSYDPLGRLFQISRSDGTATQFLYDGNAMVAEYASGTLSRRYVHADSDDTPVLEIDVPANTIRQLIADHQGSIVATTQHGWNLIGINTYDEYGVDGTNNIGRFGYTGQAYIPELGMYYYKARMYAPRLGRFMQTDPIGYDDQINLYAYVGNDPLNVRDPSGKERCQGNIKECQKITEGMNEVRKEAKKGSGDALNEVEDVLGKFGEGTTIQAAPERAIEAEYDEEKDIIVVGSIILESGNTHLVGGSIVHEGTHRWFAIKRVKMRDANGSDRMENERTAYTVENIYRYRKGWNLHSVESSAKKSFDKACEHSNHSSCILPE